MKITSFNPMIISKNAEDAIKLFEELGFKKRHTNSNVDGLDITNFTLSHPDGFRVDVTSADVPQDMALIRLNVDNFEEVYDYLISKGFVNHRGHVVESKSSKTAMMRSMSGFMFGLCQHIKK